MSHLKYFAYEGVGVNNQQKFRYSQAVRLGDRIECAGQGARCFDICESFESELLLISLQVDGTPRLANSTRRSMLKSMRPLRTSTST